MKSPTTLCDCVLEKKGKLITSLPLDLIGKSNHSITRGKNYIAMCVHLKKKQKETFLGAPAPLLNIQRCFRQLRANSWWCNGAILHISQKSNSAMPTSLLFIGQRSTFMLVMSSLLSKYISNVCTCTNAHCHVQLSVHTQKR